MPEKDPDLASPAATTVGTSGQPAAGSVTLTNATERRTPTMVYVGLAATGVFTVVATVTGVVTMSKAKDFDNATNPADRHEIASSGKTFSWLTNIGAGAALLSAGATAYFYFTAEKERPVASASTARAAQGSNIRLAPIATPNAGGLFVTGNF